MARVCLAARASLGVVLVGLFGAAAGHASPSAAKAGDAAKVAPGKAGPPKSAGAKADDPKPRTGKAEKSKPTKATGAGKLPEAAPEQDNEPPAATPSASPAAGTPDPQLGVGTRSVAGLTSSAPAPAPATATATAAATATEDEAALTKPPKTAERIEKTATGHASRQKGKPPHKPSSTLPVAASRAAPDRFARQKIADGPTDEDLRAGKDDPELRSLRAAERVLFPRPLSGVEPGWSWDLPEAVDKGGPEVITQGAPTLDPVPVRRATVEGAPDAVWLKSLTMPNIPVALDEFVIKYLRFYRDSPSGKAIARVWTKKSGRYSAAMRGELARAGVPTDLVWLSMIESGHNATITSPAGAAGLWQFMPDAGRTYGLTVDRWVDERLDPERSTQAASRYLSDLYRRFGSWELAIASYNMGYAGLARAIRKYNSNDFWELVRYEAGIPWETTLYVPKILALAIVMNNKNAFGLDSVESEPPESFDIVLVGPSVALADVARAASVTEAELSALNPSLLAARTPPWMGGSSKPSFRIHVPLGKGAQCSATLSQLGSAEEAFATYVTKFGETVESIANAHAVSEARLRALNHVEPKEVLAAGTVLLVPRAAHVAAVPNDEVVVVPPREFAYADRTRLFYRVLPGDTLSRVASVFAVSVPEIDSWNALDENARLQPGMALQLFVDRSKRFVARVISPSETHVLTAGSPEFYDYFEGQNGRKRVVVGARENDTLATLGKRYGMTVGSMERINRRSRTDKLHAGESIVVYVDRGRSVAPRSEPDSEDLASGTLLPLEPALDANAPEFTEPTPLAGASRPPRPEVSAP